MRTFATSQRTSRLIVDNVGHQPRKFRFRNVLCDNLQTMICATKDNHNRTSEVKSERKKSENYRNHGCRALRNACQRYSIPVSSVRLWWRCWLQLRKTSNFIWMIAPYSFTYGWKLKIDKNVFDNLRMLGENASPLNKTNGFKCWNVLTAVKNLAAPPIGSVAEFGSTL